MTNAISQSLSLLVIVGVFGVGHTSTIADEIVVRDSSELRNVLSAPKHGLTVKIAPGEYPGGYSISGVDRLTIEALDPDNPPVFKGGNAGWHFSRCPNLSLRHLRISGQKQNGLNLDDGGEVDRPVTGITLEQIEVTDIGPKGNFDGIKCSGLDGLKISNCSINGWGGQGIDMVGCHDSLITQCRFEGKAGFSASSGLQTKGGCSKITVEKCHFINAGSRALNVGGSTGLAYFRPAGTKYEAKDIVVRNNTIEGSQCAAAFVGVVGAEFSNNKVLFPDKWVFRILQETTTDDFVKCQNVLLKNNLIVFRREQVQIEINVGAGTVPETFSFEGNHWFAADKPQASKPQLPTPESKGVYGIDPR